MTTTLQATREEVLAKVCRILSSPYRIHLLRIVREGGGTLTVAQLVEAMNERYLPIDQPNVSHHLKTLRKAGLIKVARRTTRNTFYIVRSDALTVIDAIETMEAML